MTLVNTETFYDTEAVPILDGVRGPVDSFTLRNEAELKATSVETGIIPEGSFRDCEIFSDDLMAIGQKKNRYDALKVREYIRILSEAKENPTIEDFEERIYADRTVREAVVVEASRKLITEDANGTLTAMHANLYGNLLDETQADLYPVFDRDIALYAANLALEAARKVDPEQAAVLAIYYPFLAEKSSKEVATLSEEKRAAWKEALHEEFDPAFKETREEMHGIELSNETLVEASTHFMRAYGIPMQPEVEDGWTVIRNEKITGFKVEPSLKQLHVGNRTNEITWPIFEQLMVHEVGVHVYRAQAGYDLNSRALANGLPGNAETEEGLGILVESLWSGKELDIVARDHFRYMAVAYASGGFDGELHDETSTYDFITHVMAAQKPGGVANPVQMQSSRKFGFDHVKRAFRGMPKGKRMTSNYAYLSGKLKMIDELSKSTKSPKEQLAFMRQGKMDTTNEGDLEFLEQVKQLNANEKL